LSGEIDPWVPEMLETAFLSVLLLLAKKTTSNSFIKLQDMLISSLFYYLSILPQSKFPYKVFSRLQISLFPCQELKNQARASKRKLGRGYGRGASSFIFAPERLHFLFPVSPSTNALGFFISGKERDCFGVQKFYECR